MHNPSGKKPNPPTLLTHQQTLLVELLVIISSKTMFANDIFLAHLHASQKMQHAMYLTITSFQLQNMKKMGALLSQNVLTPPTLFNKKMNVKFPTNQYSL